MIAAMMAIILHDCVQSALIPTQIPMVSGDAPSRISSSSVPSLERSQSRYPPGERSRYIALTRARQKRWAVISIQALFARHLFDRVRFFLLVNLGLSVPQAYFSPSS